MPPPPKTRGINFLNVGVQGRRTGVTLKDTGVRDEHGMELIDGIFSSPAKSSPKKDVVQSIETAQEDESADVVDELPKPSAKRTTSRRARASILPPTASPSKTGLRSPAIRHPSLGRGSSPVGPHLSSPARRPAPDVRRQLDFTKSKIIPSAEQAPVQEPVKSSPRKANKRFTDSESPAARSKKATSKAAAVERVGQAEPPQSTRRGKSTAIEEPEQEVEDVEPSSARKKGKSLAAIASPVDSDPFLEPNNDYEEELLEPLPEDPLDIVSPQLSSAKKRRREIEEVAAPIARMTKKSPKGKQTASVYYNEEPQLSPPAQRQKARPKPKAQPVFEVSGEEDIDVYEDPGRPRKRARETPEFSESPPPARRGKSSAAADNRISLKKSSTKVPRERDPNVRAPARARAPSEISVEEVKQKTNPQRKERGLVSQGMTYNRGSSAARSLQRERSEDPNKKSRSGRAIIKPLAYWRNERIIYGEAQKKKNGIIVLPSIKEVVRTEDIEEDKPKVKKESKKKRRQRDLSEDIEDVQEEPEDPALQPEPWEEIGVFSGEIRSWADDSQVVEAVEQELAYAGSAILTREVLNSDFRMAKTFAMPFFGAGFVDIPPRGAKHVKNSGKMHLVFFVHEGKAVVNIMDNEFAIIKGGVFQVPRGNLYSISNPSDVTTARIFFAQGCEVPVENI